MLKVKKNDDKKNAIVSLKEEKLLLLLHEVVRVKRVRFLLETPLGLSHQSFCHFLLICKSLVLFYVRYLENSFVINMSKEFSLVLCVFCLVFNFEGS